MNLSFPIGIPKTRDVITLRIKAETDEGTIEILHESIISARSRISNTKILDKIDEELSDSIIYTIDNLLTSLDVKKKLGLTLLIYLIKDGCWYVVAEDGWDEKIKVEVSL